MKRFFYASLALAAVSVVSLQPMTASAGSIFSYAFSSLGTTPTPSGAGVVGSAGDIWTLDSDPSAQAATPLQDVAGSTAAGITFAHSAFSGHNSAAGQDRPGNANGLQNGWFSGAAQTYTFDGFSATDTVDLYLFGYYAHGPGTPFPNINRGASFTVGATTLETGDARATGEIENPDYLLDDNYVVFTGLTGATSYTVTTGGSTGNTFYDVNGFQVEVTPVPEPGALAALSVFAAIGCAVGRRKR